MKTFQKLLVPIDFSVYSREATRVAANLARTFDASLTLIHVYDPLIFALPDGLLRPAESQIEKLFQAFKSELDRARQQAVEAGAPRVETKLLEGFVAGEIVEFAKQGQFDLIVMGTHGRTGMGHFFVGSTAERVVRLSQCPVLTLKSQASE